MNPIYLLACESSCDETAFTIYDISSETIVASLINSQIEMHQKNGGVIPELASHFHYHAIGDLLTQIIKKANITLDDISFFAATQGPGLSGALLIGFTFVKALAWNFKKPFIPINHLEGHIYSAFLNNNIIFPYLCISVSGGHSSIYYVESFFSYKKLGQTRDDACGECFDKVAKLLSLPYPGGRYIEEIAHTTDYQNKRNYPISHLSDGSISFSGLKTAILYDLIKNNHYNEVTKKIHPETPIEFITEVAVSAQYTIAHMLEYWLMSHLQNTIVNAVVMVGGVACNEIIKKQLTRSLEKLSIPFLTPLKKYCCDNADMIALVATKKIKAGNYNMRQYDQGIFNNALY
jgi:N6-L-threonylcarbamoyladenine synthase